MKEPLSTDFLSIRPCGLRQAREFVELHHRHHHMPQGGLWALALMRGDELVGVAIAGRPVSRLLQRDGYCEVIRVCVLPNVRNGCSKLYARVRRVAAQMGYTSVVTYTLPEERGPSLRGAGFAQVAHTKGGSWNRPSRPRRDQHSIVGKVRWEAST